jgi:tetratricopeptide (TPR) repeat protein
MVEGHTPNYYETLGVQDRATHDEIEDAYHELARMLHPDVTGNDEKLTARYMLINEAWQVLSRSDTREKYDESIGLEKPSAEQQAIKRVIHKKSEQAAGDMRLLDLKLKRSLKAAEKLCESGSFWQASNLLEGYLKTHADSVPLRRMLAQAAAGRHRFHEAVSHQEVVCKVEYYNADNYAVLGNIYIRAGRLDVAERVLNEALTWDDKHAGALKDLARVIELRETSRPLIKRLIGKLGSISIRKG